MTLKVGDTVPVSILNTNDFTGQSLSPAAPSNMVFTVSNVGENVVVLYADTFDCKRFRITGLSGDEARGPLIGIIPEGMNEGEYGNTWLRFEHTDLFNFDVIAKSASKYMAIVVLGIMSFQEEWKKVQ